MVANGIALLLIPLVGAALVAVQKSDGARRIVLGVMAAAMLGYGAWLVRLIETEGTSIVAGWTVVPGVVLEWQRGPEGAVGLALLAATLAALVAGPAGRPRAVGACVACIAALTVWFGGNVALLLLGIAGVNGVIAATDGKLTKTDLTLLVVPALAVAYVALDLLKTGTLDYLLLPSASFNAPDGVILGCAAVLELSLPGLLSATHQGNRIWAVAAGAGMLLHLFEVLDTGTAGIAGEVLGICSTGAFSACSFAAYRLRARRTSAYRLLAVSLGALTGASAFIGSEGGAAVIVVLESFSLIAALLAMRDGIGHVRAGRFARRALLMLAGGTPGGASALVLTVLIASLVTDGSQWTVCVLLLAGGWIACTSVSWFLAFGIAGTQERLATFADAASVAVLLAAGCIPAIAVSGVGSVLSTNPFVVTGTFTEIPGGVLEYSYLLVAGVIVGAIALSTGVLAGAVVYPDHEKIRDLSRTRLMPDFSRLRSRSSRVRSRAALLVGVADSFLDQQPRLAFVLISAGIIIVLVH